MSLRFKVGDRVFSYGHGYGVVVEVRMPNPQQDNSAVDYLLSSRGSSALAESEQLRNVVSQPVVVSGIVNSLYGPDRYPYRIRFEPCERYPEGYCDVYGPGEIYADEAEFKAAMKRQREKDRRARNARLRELAANPISLVAEDLLTHPKVSREEIDAAAANRSAYIDLLRRVRNEGLVGWEGLRQAREAVDGAIAHRETYAG